jgi:hypothetical protein
MSLVIITCFLRYENSAAFAYKQLMYHLFWRNKLILFASREISPSLLESIKGEITFRRSFLEQVRNSSEIIAAHHFSIKFSYEVLLVFWTCVYTSGLPVAGRLNISVCFCPLHNTNAYCKYFITLMFVKQDICWT